MESNNSRQSLRTPNLAVKRTRTGGADLLAHQTLRAPVRAAYFERSAAQIADVASTKLRMRIYADRGMKALQQTQEQL